MKKLLFSVLLLTWAFPQSEQATITLYKDGFGLVKQPVTFRVRSGRNTLTYSYLPDRIEPRSPFLSLEGAHILYQKYSLDVFDSFEFLKTHLGEKVKVKLAEGRGYKGKLLDVDGEWITVSRWGSVRVFNLDEVSTIKVSPSGAVLSTRPELSWEVESPRKATITGELIYIGEGFDWDADYRMVISADETITSLVSYAVIKNGTNLDFLQATVELVEGELKTLFRRGAPRPSVAGRIPGVTQVPGEERLVFDREPLGDYYLYSLGGRLTLPRQESIAVPLYPQKDIPFQRLYLFENRERSSREEPLIVQVSFTNTEEYGLGMPLPGGVLQIYFSTPDGAVKFGGEDFLRQVAIGERAKVIAGRAFDVLGKRTVVNYDRQKKSEEATILLEIQNKREDPVSVRLTEHIYGDWVIRDPSHGYKKTDVETIQFDLTLPGSSTESVTYTYLKEWQ
ncbi:MAG: DUF4139 domain-containing protein [Fidelibacterota bacterium]